MKKFLTIALLLFTALLLASCVEDDDFDFADTDAYNQNGNGDYQSGDNNGQNNGSSDYNSEDDQDDLPEAIQNEDTTSDTTDTTPSDPTDTTDTDTGTDTTDTGTDTTDTGTDTTDTGTDTTDTGTDTTDTGTDTTDTGTDTTDTGTDTTDTGTDTTDTGTDTTDTGTDTGDTGNIEDPCIEITLGNFDYYDYGHWVRNVDRFDVSFTPNIGSSDEDNLYFDLYGDGIDVGEGTYYLDLYDWTDEYGVFLYVCEDRYYDSYYGEYYCSKLYFQREGTLQITDYELNWASAYLESFKAKLNGVVLEQINNSGTPVEGGGCFKINDTTLSYTE